VFGERDEAMSDKYAVIKWTEVGHVMVFCGTGGQIPIDTWETFNKELKTKPVSKVLCLSILGSGDLTSVQRATTADILKKRGINMGVVTDDKLVRGMVTAASWVGANIKAFSWTEFPEVFKYLDVPAALEIRMMATVNSLRKACEDEYSSAARK
jgi:hypothetical protein